MLGRDLLRVRIKGDQAEPLWLSDTPAVRDLAQQLLQLWRDHIGSSRAEIDDLLPPIIHGCRSQVMAKGLNKLISDESTFADLSDLVSRRALAFDESAQALRDAPASTAAAHRQQVQKAMAPDDLLASDDPQSLYADLPQRARLASAPQWSPKQLIDHYNMHLAQGLLLSANALQVHIIDQDVGRRRQLLKAMRFQRLLAALRAGEGADLHLEIAGPGVMLEQKSRYGLQLACFLPHLACLSQWRAEAMVLPPRAEAPLRLRLDHSCPLQGSSRFLDYTPPELRRLSEQLSKKLPQWQIIDESSILPLDDGDMLVADCRLQHENGAVYYLECFHRWHAAALGRRLQQLSQGKAPRLILGVDRRLAKQESVSDHLAQPLLAQRSFLFNDFPTATALGRVLKQLPSAPTAST